MAKAILSRCLKWVYKTLKLRRDILGPIRVCSCPYFSDFHSIILYITVSLNIRNCRRNRLRGFNHLSNIKKKIDFIYFLTNYRDRRLFRNKKKKKLCCIYFSRYLHFWWGLPWPLSYGNWIYNYLCNQCLSPLMLGVRILIRVRCTT